MSEQQERRCPECGGAENLYGRADVRWDRGLKVWVVGDMEAEIDCTECDWSGTEAETVYDEGALDATDDRSADELRTGYREEDFA